MVGESWGVFMKWVLVEKHISGNHVWKFRGGARSGAGTILRQGGGGKDRGAQRGEREKKFFPEIGGFFSPKYSPDYKRFYVPKMAQDTSLRGAAAPLPPYFPRLWGHTPFSLAPSADVHEWYKTSVDIWKSDITLFQGYLKLKRYKIIKSLLKCILKYKGKRLQA